MTNQRRCFRISVAEDQRPATLRVHGKNHKVVLEDESAGGFAVLVNGSLMLKAGQRLQLHTASGWSVVRVAHSACVGDHTRIGLERLEDLPDKKSVDDSTSTWASYLLPWGDYGGLGWSIWCGALAVAAGLLIWFGRSHVQTAWGSLHTGNSKQHFQNFSQDFQERWKAAEASGARIELDAKQQRAIRDILHRAEQDILTARSRKVRDPRAEAERFRASEQEILEVLTPEQRAQWENLNTVDAPGSSE